MTPDQDLSARLAKLMQAVKSAQNDTDCGVTPFLNKRALYIEALIAAHTSGQLITLADHTAAVQAAVEKAVEAEREAAKSLVWTLGHEIRSAMLVDEDNEQTVLDMVKATAAAIRSRGVAG